MSIGELSEFKLLAQRAAPQAWMDWEAWFDALAAGSHKAIRTQDFDSFPSVLQESVAVQGVALGWGRSVEGLIAEGKLVRLCDESVYRADEISVYRGNRFDKEVGIEALLFLFRNELG